MVCYTTHTEFTVQHPLRARRTHSPLLLQLEVQRLWDGDSEASVTKVVRRPLENRHVAADAAQSNGRGAPGDSILPPITATRLPTMLGMVVAILL
jgi:hypothetical protein